MSGPQREKLGELNNSLQDLLIDISWFFVVVEGWIASQQLVNENADAPVVNCFPISGFISLLKHFRGQVLRGAADGKGAQVM